MIFILILKLHSMDPFYFSPWDSWIAQSYLNFLDLAVIPWVQTKFYGFILMTVVLDSWLSGTKQIASSLELVESPHC